MSLSLGLRIPSVPLRAAGPGVPAWLPTDEAEVRGWYVANNQPEGDGVSVPAWADLSGIGNDMEQGTASRQATVAANHINGFKALRFTGDNQQRYALPNLMAGAAVGTGILVLKLVADPSVSPKGGLWTFGTASEVDLWPFTDGQIYDGFGGTARHTTGVNPTPALTEYRIITARSAANSKQLRIDGTQIYTSGTNTVAWKVVPWFGMSDKLDAVTFWFLDGWVAEFQIFSDGAIHEKAEGYLAHKYGLQGNLPGGHPYKAAPP
jgi:hypothetical protein